MSPSREAFISKLCRLTHTYLVVILTLAIANSETVVTLILVLEIFLRFAADWRNFHKDKRNWIDLGLAIITAVIQIPRIRNSGQPYAWLTFFQILRVYRVVLAVPMTRKLLVSPSGTFAALSSLLLMPFSGDCPRQRYWFAESYNLRVSRYVSYCNFRGANFSRRISTVRCTKLSCSHYLRGYLQLFHWYVPGSVQ